MVMRFTFSNGGDDVMMMMMMISRGDRDSERDVTFVSLSVMANTLGNNILSSAGIALANNGGGNVISYVTWLGMWRK